MEASASILIQKTSVKLMALCEEQEKTILQLKKDLITWQAILLKQIGDGDRMDVGATLKVKEGSYD